MAGKFTVVIPWSNRPELATALKMSLPVLYAGAGTIVIVNCGGSSAMLSELLRDVSGLPPTHVVTVPDSRFNRSLALNIGLLHAPDELLLMMDSDIVFVRDIFAEAAPILAAGDKCLTVGTVRESAPDRSALLPFIKADIIRRELMFANGHSVRLMSRTGGDGSRSGSGLLLVAAEHLRAVGGYNSDLVGWGFEDVDAIIRLQIQLGLEHMLVGEALHLSHDDDVRATVHGSKSMDYQRNLSVSLNNYERGQYSGTYIRDAETWRDRIAPPTADSISSPG